MESATTSPPMTADELLADGTMSVDEAVKFTSLSRPELYRRMAAGQLRFVKHGTRRLIPKRSLVALLAAGLKPATAAAPEPGRATGGPPSKERRRERPVQHGATTG